MFLPDGHDPDTLVQAIGAEEFRKRLDAAMPLSQLVPGEPAKQVSLGNLSGRRRQPGLASPAHERPPAQGRSLGTAQSGPVQADLLAALAKQRRIGRVPVFDGILAMHPAPDGNRAGRPMPHRNLHAGG